MKDLPKFQLGARPTKLPAELFTCDPTPGAWPAGADDVQVAVNETKRTAAGESCRRQLYTICKVQAANNLVIGECIAPKGVKP